MLFSLFNNHFDKNSIQVEARVYGAKCDETWLHAYGSN